MPEVLRRLARVCAKLQDFAEMDRTLSELETGDFSNEAAQRAELMRALNDVGVELITAKHYDRAIQILKKGIEVGASLRDADMTLLGHMHYNSGLAEGLSERHNDALLEFKKAQSAYTLAKSPTNVADAVTAQGQALVTLGLHEQAIATFEHEIELRSEVASPGVSSELIDAIMRLGAVFSALDRNRDEAALYEDLFQRLPDLDEQGPSDQLCVPIGAAQNNLGYCYFKLGRFDDARRLLRESLRSLALAPQETLAEAFVQESLGELLAAENDLSGTKAAYERAVELRRRLAPQTDARLARTLRDLAAVCDRLGELEESDVAAASCYELLRNAADSDPFETAKVAEMAAHIADRLGETQKRDRLLFEATSLRKSAEEVQASSSSEVGSATAGAPSVTSPSMGFLTREEITHVVLESHLSRGTREILPVMLLFETMKQHTWLVGTPSKLFCLLDDEKHRASGRLIQWEQSWRSIRSVEVKPYKPKTGLVTIGRCPNWLYSVRLHPDPEGLRNGIVGMQPQRLTQERERRH
jgi:tetratricopeptide (TPR) repeat protein